MIVALFDCDGTLYSNQMGRGMMKYEELQGRGQRARRYFVSLLPRYAMSRAGLLKAESFQYTLLDGLTHFFKGSTVAEADELFGWVANEYLLATQRPETTERLKDHLAQGHKVILASGSFAPCLQHIGDHFGVQDLIGTQLEVRDGRYTGKIILPVITSDAKASKIRGLVQDQEIEVDWENSYAYGDSFTDVNMLQMVGHPVAVHPDSKLNKLAEQKGWEVIGTPKG